MPDPVFSAEDRVDNEALPPELVGKTPKEIAQYYQRREQIMLDRIDRTPPPSTKKEIPAEPAFDIFNDPKGSVDRTVVARVNEALSSATATVAPAVIASCKIAMSNNHQDWGKYKAEVERTMATFSPDAQMNPDYWENTYLLAKGKNADKAIEEAVNQARNPVERPTPKGEDPPKPRSLSDQERIIALRFGDTDAEYVAASARYETTDGLLPFTMDTERKKRKKTA